MLDAEGIKRERERERDADLGLGYYYAQKRGEKTKLRATIVRERYVNIWTNGEQTATY